MRIFILGTGKMGAWLTEELCWNHEVWVHDADPLKMKYFMKVHRILDLAELDQVKPELFINSVALGNTTKAFDTVLPHIPESCILADIASVKNGLQDYYGTLGRPFVSSHPMFGPTLANIRDLKDESAIIISESCEAGKAFFRELYSRLSIKIFEYSSRSTIKPSPTPWPPPSPPAWSSPPACENKKPQGPTSSGTWPPPRVCSPKTTGCLPK